jgi:hypothetical protein
VTVPVAAYSPPTSNEGDSRLNIAAAALATAHGTPRHQLAAALADQHGGSTRTWERLLRQADQVTGPTQAGEREDPR